jgi:GNAT superfamily N-acetyltransferase
LSAPITIRPATGDDADELARLRWDFSPDQVAAGLQEFSAFLADFREFWSGALASGKWTAWVAELDARLIGNVWIERIDKVPRPGRSCNEYSYVTNVYVEAEHRNGGVGAALMRAAIAEARARPSEFLIVWPSEEAVRFYERLGFAAVPDALELPIVED